VSFRPASECYIISAGSPDNTVSLSNASLWVDYIYLDTDERRQFAQVQHKIICVIKLNNKTVLLVN